MFVRLARTHVVLFALLVVLVTSRSAHAQDASLSGQWSATAMTVTWRIGEWGPACGPQPSGGGAPAGTVTVERRGSELFMTGAGRNYSTLECWEQYPGLTRTSHSAGGSTWRNTCRTPPGDPRQASLITTVTASPSQIAFDETGQYQFVIKGQNCTASVRRTRYLRPLVARDSAPPAPSAAPTPEAKPTCKTPGPPARLEVRPSRKLMRPGETFSFRGVVLDARGCTLPVAPSFRVAAGPEDVNVTSAGRIEVPETAAEGELKLVASAGGRSVSVAVEIVSRERYDALLAEGRFDQSGASSEAAVAKLESSSIGSRETVVRDDSERHRTWFVALVGGAALVLGLVGLVLVQRSRRAVRRREAAPVSTPRMPPAPRPATVMLCPTCREEYPAGAQFCAKDGNRLVPGGAASVAGPTGAVCPVCGQGYDPGVLVCPKHDEVLVPPAVYQATRPPSPPKITKICPVCGAQFPGDSGFCGACGAALVPVN